MNDPTESTPDREPADSTLTKVTINYLSQPFYQGCVNSNSDYHGAGRLISLNGDDYNGNISE